MPLILSATARKALAGIVSLWRKPAFLREKPVSIDPLGWIQTSTVTAKATVLQGSSAESECVCILVKNATEPLCPVVSAHGGIPGLALWMANATNATKSRMTAQAENSRGSLVPETACMSLVSSVCAFGKKHPTYDRQCLPYAFSLHGVRFYVM